MKTTAALLLPITLLGAAVTGCDDTPAPAQQDAFATSIPVGHITFGDDGAPTLDGPLLRDGKVVIDYDTSRLATCEGTDMGQLAWSVTAHVMQDGAEATSFDVLSPNRPQGGAVSFELTAREDLTVWFEAVNKWGCQAWDSDYGANYNFRIGDMAAFPSWAGTPRHLITRATCGGSPCPGDAVALESDFHFGTWARQRAAITEVVFEAWEPGVTDWDNPDLWRTLDAQIHYRFADDDAFTSAYVDARRAGHNARYAFDLRSVDPLGAGTLTDPAQCPDVPLRSDDALVYADMAFYFTIGDLEIRPAFGETFRGEFADYRGLYAICGH